MQQRTVGRQSLYFFIFLHRVIDSDYRGVVQLLIRNFGEIMLMEKGDRIAQLLIVEDKPMQIQEIERMAVDTVRGTGCFGSTGKKTFK